MLRSIPPVLRATTRDLPAVPPLAQYLIGCWLGPILAWVEAALVRIILARCPDHPLVQIAQWYDPAPVVTACAAYYHGADQPGKPPTFTIDLLVRASSSAPGPYPAPTATSNGICSRIWSCAPSSACLCSPPPPTTARLPVSTPGSRSTKWRPGSLTC